MAFICLGWGSLIWCQKALPIVGGWQIDGPALPLEFARESRDRRFTLVVCEDVPPSTTLWATLGVQTLAEAKQVLAERESVTAANVNYSVGWWNPDGTSGQPAAAVIGEWARRRGYDGVVWTALKAKIGNEYRVPSLQEVIDHLAGLDGAERDGAEEYVRLAPRQIRTPYRAAIEAAFDWTPLGLV